MKFLLYVVLSISCLGGNARVHKTALSHAESHRGNYFSFNPLALAEPQMAIGIGMGNRFTVRSEYFAELSYLRQSPMFPDWNQSLTGFRGVFQYRYHLLNPRRLFEGWRTSPPTHDGKQKWIAFEGRIKNYSFSAVNSFTNEATADTLLNYLYTAGANVIGGAILFGTTYSPGAKKRWQVELSLGIGAKQKFARFKNIPPGYQVALWTRGEWGFMPKSYESVGTPYLPFAFRVRYRLNKKTNQL